MQEFVPRTSVTSLGSRTTELTEMERSQLGSGSLQERLTALKSLLGTSEKKPDFAELFELVSKWPKGERGFAETLIVLRWAEVDPQPVLRFVEENDVRRAHLIRSVIRTWAASDPDAAMDAALSVRRRTAFGNGLYKAALQGIFDSNPARAFALWSAGQQDGTHPPHDGSWVKLLPIGKWVGSDPEGALRMVQSVQNPERRKELEFYLIREMAETMPQRVMELWGERPGVKSLIYDHWAKVDPEAVAKRAESELDLKVKRNAVNAVLRSWVEKDPESAFDWFEKNVAVADRKGSLRYGMEYLGSVDLDAAWQMAMKLEPKGDWERAFSNLGSYWADHDPDGVAEWVQSLGQDERESMGSQFVENFSKQWSKHDPTAAAEFVENFEDPAVRGRMARQVAPNLAHFDGEAATELLGLVQEESDRAAEELALAWGMRAPVAARDWTDELPEGQIRDRAERGLVRAIAPHDPDAALSLASGIDGPGARMGAIMHAINWITDRELAREKILAELPDDSDRRTILKELDSRGR